MSKKISKSKKEALKGIDLLKRLSRVKKDESIPEDLQKDWREYFKWFWDSLDKD